MKCRQRLYLTADNKKLVAEGHKDAALLYAVPGDEIPESAVEMFGLVDGALKGAKIDQVEPPAPPSPPAPPPPAAKAGPKAKAAAKHKGAKAVKPSQTKEAAPSENKEAAPSDNKTGDAGAGTQPAEDGAGAQ